MLGTLVDTPVDVLEQELIALENGIARLRVAQLERIRKLADAQIHTTDGAASMGEWLRGRLDIATDTARNLYATAKRLAEDDTLETVLEGRDVSFDRVVATARLIDSGADPDLIEASFGHDITGVHRLTARRTRMTPEQDRTGYQSQWLMLQPTLDNTGGRLSGQLWGLDYTTVEKALTERGDECRRTLQPALGPIGRRQALAHGLVAMAQDSLDGYTAEPTGRSEPAVAVIVDHDLAEKTNGEAGAEVADGPKLGPITLQSLLCGSPINVIGLQGGRPVVTTSQSRTIPPAIRRHIAMRDGGCSIDGCTSTYRLQPHHVRLWSHTKNHDPDSIITGCWYHHHIAIHRNGYRIDPNSPPNRIRLLPPTPT